MAFQSENKETLQITIIAQRMVYRHECVQAGQAITQAREAHRTHKERRHCSAALPLWFRGEKTSVEA